MSDAKILTWRHFAGYYVGAGGIKGSGSGAGDACGYGYERGAGYGDGKQLECEYYFGSISIEHGNVRTPTRIFNYCKEIVNKYE